MAEKVYECMFILDSNAYARDPGSAANKIQKLVVDAKGEMLASRLWVEQKLAFPINGRHKGTYWLTYFKLDPAELGGFNRQCRLSDIVMRHLVIKIDPRLVDTMVSAAHGSASEESTPPAKEPAAGGDEAKDAPAKELVEEPSAKGETAAVE